MKRSKHDDERGDRARERLRQFERERGLLDPEPPPGDEADGETDDEAPDEGDENDDAGGSS